VHGFTKSAEDHWRVEIDTLEQRGGLTSRQFIRYGLLHLQLGEALRGFTYDGQPRALAPPAEILALFPELQAPA
jgi:hypothetical protein